jgi:hypothetical protein
MIKGRVRAITRHENPDGKESYCATLSLTSALDGGRGCQRYGRFTPATDTVRIVQEGGWAPGPVRTGAENLALTGIRSPDRPARSESLYRLSYRGPHTYVARERILNQTLARLRIIEFDKFSPEYICSEVAIQKRKD